MMKKHQLSGGFENCRIKNTFVLFVYSLLWMIFFLQVAMMLFSC